MSLVHPQQLPIALKQKGPQSQYYSVGAGKWHMKAHVSYEESDECGLTGHNSRGAKGCSL